MGYSSSGSHDNWGGGGASKTPRTPKPPKTPKPPVPTPVDPNAWAYKPPPDAQTLLRQLSANVGQEFMPYGPGGDVRQAAFGSSAAPQMNVDPATYGETGGETNFFQTTTKGGMAPISSVPRTVSNWDPLGLFKTVAPKPGNDGRSGGGGGGGPIGGPGRMNGSGRTPEPTPPTLPAGLTPEQLMGLLNSIFPTQ
jgi:hypothetical protein